MELSAAWVLDPPRETAARQLDSPPSPLAIGLVLTGSLLSITLSELLIVPEHPLGFGLSYFSFLLAFVLMALLFHQLSRIAGAPPASFGQWVNAGTIALVPLNLLLPLALMFRSFGNSGLAFYELFKIMITWAVFRRWVWVIEAITKWPPWACLVLLVGPFAFAAIAGLLMVVLLASMILVMALTGLR